MWNWGMPVEQRAGGSRGCALFCFFLFVCCFGRDKAYAIVLETRGAMALVQCERSNFVVEGGKGHHLMPLPTDLDVDFCQSFQLNLAKNSEWLLCIYANITEYNRFQGSQMWKITLPVKQESMKIKSDGSIFVSFEQNHFNSIVGSLHVFARHAPATYLCSGVGKRFIKQMSRCAWRSFSYLWQPHLDRRR